MDDDDDDDDDSDDNGDNNYDDDYDADDPIYRTNCLCSHTLPIYRTNCLCSHTLPIYRTNCLCIHTLPICRAKHFPDGHFRFVEWPVFGRGPRRRKSRVRGPGTDFEPKVFQMVIFAL